ncbi:MAG TPA: response regulator [Vicinamibacterales bacterium]
METLVVRRVSIPVAAAPPEPARPSVLLVTGDTDLRAAVARALERQGYDVHAAAHAGHAWLACLTARRLDVVIAELSMDDTSGPALAERLRRHHPDVQALYFAKSGTPECDNVLVRPFTRDDLVTRLDELLALAWKS